LRQLWCLLSPNHKFFISFHNHPNYPHEIHSGLSGKDVHNLIFRPGQYSSTAMITGDMSPNFAYTIKPTKKTQEIVADWLSNPYHKQPPDFSKLYSKYVNTALENYLNRTSLTLIEVLSPIHGGLIQFVKLHLLDRALSSD